MNFSRVKGRVDHLPSLGRGLLGLDFGKSTRDALHVFQSSILSNGLLNDLVERGLRVSIVMAQSHLTAKPQSPVVSPTRTFPAS